MQNRKSPLNDKRTALARAMKYCAYQERSQQEVRGKLVSLGVPRGLAEEIIAELIGEGFINEERFARSYAGGRFRLKGWGRIRIRAGLLARGVSEHCIRSGLEEIDGRIYRDKLKEILDERLQAADEQGIFIRKRKAAAYAVSRGYEPQLVWDLLNEKEDERENENDPEC